MTAHKEGVRDRVAEILRDNLGHSPDPSPRIGPCESCGRNTGFPIEPSAWGDRCNVCVKTDRIKALLEEGDRVEVCTEHVTEEGEPIPCSEAGCENAALWIEPNATQPSTTDPVLYPDARILHPTQAGSDHDE